MARVKRAVNAHKKRRVILERASGYRGMLAELAVNEPATFASLVATAKKALPSDVNAAKASA